MGAKGGAGSSIVVVGSLNCDLVVPVEAHPAPGETVLGGDYFKAPGGKGANQAVAAARLGQSVSMLGYVGDDAEGEWLLEALRTDGVSMDFVGVHASAPTGVAFIQVSEGGDNSIVVSPGANARLTPARVRSATALLAGATTVLLQLEVPVESVEVAARLATGTVILNPAPATRLPPSLLGEVDVLVPNMGELATLVDAAPPTTLAEVAKMARRLPGRADVVVTLGAEGALIVRAGEPELHVPGIPVQAIDTTAAGDCFCGALADALTRGEDLVQAVRWAVRCSSVSVARRGAQPSLPTRDECRIDLQEAL